MAYTTPKVQITQDFVETPAVANQPLPAFIVGPQKDLHRFGVAAEQPLIQAVNPNGTSGAAYVPGSNVVYPYPAQTPGTTVETSSVEVVIAPATAQYFPNATLGSTAGTNNVFELVQTGPSTGKYFPNQLRFTTASGTVAKTGNGYARSAYFSNRDVQVGDVLNITDNLGNTLSTEVNAILADTVTQDGTLASTIGVALASGTDGVSTGTTTFTSASGAFTGLAGNVITITGKGTYTIVSVTSATSVVLSGTVATGTGLTYKVGGVYNDVGNIGIQSAVINNTPTFTGTGSTSGITLATTPTTAYVGYPALRIANDVYTVTCTSAGSLTTAQFSISSQNGAFATKTGVTLSSGILIIDNAGGNAVGWNFTGSTGAPVFATTFSWTVAVSAAVTLVNPAVSGTYTGAGNIIYKLTVTKGGAAYNGTSNASTCAQLTVTSNNTDSSPAILLGSTAINVGTLGVLATFSGGSLNSQYVLGDSYYISVVANALGHFKILQFNDSLPQATLSLSGATPITGTLSLVQPEFVVPALNGATVNYVATTQNLTLNAGITTADPNLVYVGTPVALPVESGTVYIQHADLNVTNATSLQSVSNAADIPGILGTIDPANPLAQGVYDAVLNSNGVPVWFIGIQTDDINGYNTALAISKASTSVYGIVPLTYDVPTQEAVVAFVDAVSTPQTARWRTAWLSIPAAPTALLYNLKSGGAAWTGTVTADPLASGTQYTLVTVAGATFIDDGIRPGDSLLINFTTNASGNVVYNTYTVGAVRTQTTLVITTALTAAINSPTKVQIQRNYSATEQVTNLGAIAASYANRRVRVVFPDNVVSGGVSMPGYFLAAALAGLRAGVVPHQGLTNTPVLGFDTLPEINSTYTSDELDILASNGVFIVTQTVAGATPYVRHQLTTDMSTVETREDSITSNVDAVSYIFQQALTPFIGIYNRNNFTLQLIKAAINAEILYLQTQSYTVTAGYQLGPNTSITSLAFDPTLADTINIAIQLDVPGPTNYINVTFTV